MAALSRILRSVEGGMLSFWCPGCDEAHSVRVRAADRPSPSWEWNKSVERPTFSPSILVRGVSMTEKGRADYEAWCEQGHPPRGGKGFDSRPQVCHSYVRDGQIQFLGDCTHKLAGKTAPLPEWPL